jgi:hypothetical protein
MRELFGEFSPRDGGFPASNGEVPGDNATAGEPTARLEPEPRTDSPTQLVISNL